MQIEILKRYSEIKQQIRSLEDEESLLKDIIIKEMGEEKVKTYPTVFGKFTVAEKLNWIYSPKVKSLEEKLKIAKIDEQESGRAQVKIKKYLTFK